MSSWHPWRVLGNYVLLFEENKKLSDLLNVKIFHIIDSGGLYGAEIMLLHLMTEHLRMGLQPVLVSIGLHDDQDKPLEDEARRLGLEVIPVRMRSGPNWAGALSILRVAHREHVNVLHSHGYKGNILFGLLPPILRRYPMISTLHGWTSVGGFSLMRLYGWLESLSLRFVNRVVLVNETMRYNPRLTNLANEMLDVIENGIPINLAESTGVERLDIQEFSANRYTYLAIGRLSSEKGFDVLLEAFAGVVISGIDAQLVILGEGDQRFFLEAKVKILGLENRVLLPGFVAKAKNYLTLFDAFVVSSLTEGLPMVLLEAMAAGIPIVATKVGGIPKVLEGGRGGLLVKARDVDALKLAMISVCKDTQIAKERSVWSAKRVRERYSSRTMAEKYAQIYYELTKNKLAKDGYDAERNTLPY